MTGTPTARVARPLPADVVRDVERRVAKAQHDWRVPGVSVGVVRHGALAHSVHAGSAVVDPATPGDDHRQFCMGSVTKTFIAVTVMRLRDAGRLSLADPLAAHLPGTRHGHLVLRDLLSHTSGLQREPVGRIWETLDMPDEATLLTGLEQAEAVLDPHTAWHYSNLAYALLGRVVETLTGRPWSDVVREQVLDPLGMAETGLVPTRPATGYFVHPHSGTVTPERIPDLRAVSAAGGLWTTVADLARYAAFLADPPPGVLAEDTVAAMARPVVLRDEAWTAGHGLGFQLARSGERVLMGHSGGMPGFVTGLQVHRSSGVAAVVSANASSGAAPMALAADLIGAVLDADPDPEQPWVPEAGHPELEGVLGPWWTEGSEVVFTVHEGSLRSHYARAPEVWSRYEPDPAGTDRWRVVEGNERGELLELDRDPSGAVVRMHLATYALTRHTLGFAELADGRPGAARP